MRILLDTHVLLWFHMNDWRLSAKAKSLIGSGDHECWYSMASFWEIAIKHSLGKLELTGGLDASLDAMEHANLLPLQLKRQHLSALSQLRQHHRDPFDRLLIAQSISEGMRLMTNDPQIQAYDISLISA